MTHRCFVLLTLAASCLNFALWAESDQGEIRTGIYRGRSVTYQWINGQAIYEGDIILDHVTEMPGGGGGDSLTLAYSKYLWPKVGNVYQVPYIIDPQSGDLTNLNTAINQFNSTFSGLIQFVARTSETDYVDFNLNGNPNGSCDSSVGRAGGEQVVGGASNCTVATILHEMGHTIGLWHEQSRSDRDTYVSVNYNNIIKGSRSNFDQLLDNDQNVTLYDYASIMHYPAYSFTRNGGPCIESNPAGIPLSNQVGYTAADIDGIMRLYNSAPTQVTVTTNPPGLQVIVDGNTITTPQVFTWTLNSSHTLGVQSGAQTAGGINYVYGRWNNSTFASQSITVLPGNGMLTQPYASPAVTVYTANFIQLVPYANTISPAGTGTMTPSPAPQNYPPLSGQYYVIRQPVMLTATPNAGQNFYEYITSPFWLQPGGLSDNPKTFYVPDDGSGINLTTYFTNSPVYSVTTNPVEAREWIQADGASWLAPKNFALPYDGTWTAGSQHTLNIDSPQKPYSINSRYEFSSWSDGGAQSHSVTLPSSSISYTASISPQFLILDYPIESCAGSINVSPPSPTGDGFYPTGSLLSFTETPNTGWTFTGWLYDLSGNGNPQNLTVSDEVLAAADFDTTATRMQLTGITPPNAVAGGGAFTLTINGQGFTTATQAYINAFFRSSTFVNSTQLTVAMTADDIALPGAFQVAVANFPSGAQCSAYIPTTFFVLTAPGTVASITPTSLAFNNQAAGSTSASQPVTLNNVGSNPVAISSITASGDFSQTNNCGTSISVGSSCTVNVTFAPSLPGNVTGALTVSDNATNTPQLATLTGTGVMPLSLNPTSLKFPTTGVGHNSTKTVTATNNEATTINLSISTAGNYSVTGGSCGAILGAGASCTVNVTFQPTITGTINGGLALSDGAPLSPQIVPLSGKGTGGPAVPLKFSPSSVKFKSVGVGASASSTVTVTNTSGSAVTISSLSASGDFAATGTGSTPCGGSLGAGAKCTMTVTFTPSTAAQLSGGVEVATSGAGSPQTLDASGTGIVPVTLSPPSLTFAAQNVGTTSPPQTVTLSNNSGSTLTISNITASGDYNASAGGGSPCGNTLAAGKTCTFNVTFTPTATGTITGAATVTHSAPLGPAVIKLTGTGQ